MANNTSSVVECVYLTTEDKVFLYDFVFWVEGVAQVGLGVAGFLGNLISCFILTRKAMRSAFNLLLVTLAAFDMWYLLGSILESIRKSFSMATDLHMVMFPYFLHPMHKIAMTGSIFMTVAIAFERYSAVHFPVDYSQVKWMINSFFFQKNICSYNLHKAWGIWGTIKGVLHFSEHAHVRKVQVTILSLK